MLRSFIPLHFGTALLLLAVAFGLSYALTPLVRRLAKRVGAMDVPKDARRMHTEPTPLLGGLAIYLSFLICTLLLFESTPFLRALLVGATIIIITGVLDDIYDLSPLLKLFAQAAAALVVISEGATITDIYLFGDRIAFGPALSIGITLLWIVGVTNATNLIDGLDGLSSGVCVIASLSLAVITMLEPSGNTTFCALLLLMAGAGAGFIPHNLTSKKGKKIFMGDTGALFLGFVLACLSVQGVFKTQAVLSFIAPVAVFSLPIFDTSFAFIRRILKGTSPFKADRKHLHHRLVDMGFTQHQTVYILWCISALVSVLTILCYIFNVDPLLTLGIVLLFFIGLYIFVGVESNRRAKIPPRSSSADLRRLKTKRLFLLDMDGTLYIENHLFKSSLLFLQYVKKIGGTYYFLTNNSSKSALDYVEKLRAMGVPAEESDFITSVQISRDYLAAHHAGQKIYVVGTHSFKRELREAGFNIAEEPDEEVSVLLVGYDTELTYEKLTAASLLLTRQSVTYLATNPDWVCPISFGSVPDCGAICQMLEHTSGRKPLVLGKPSPLMVEEALRRSGFSAEEALIVGDRLYTDIACGAAAGIDSAFVLSGEGRVEDIPASDVRPTYTFDEIGDLIRAVVE